MSGNGWEFDGNRLTLTENGSFHIIGEELISTKNRIHVATGKKVDVLLDNVNIDVTAEDSRDNGLCAFGTAGAEIDLFLKGTNSLTSGRGYAGLAVSADTSITINSVDGLGSENGVLYVVGGCSFYGPWGDLGAGIGASYNTDDLGLDNNTNGRRTAFTAGKITINGGTISAHGEVGIGSRSGSSQ